jgi:CRISPR system Cascade subunit CasA
VPFSLLRERWLPFRTRGGNRRWIAPPEIVTVAGADALVAPDWGRADFDSATLEFLIGLLATAYPPKDLRQWTERFKSPPSANDLIKSFSSFALAFELDGDGPRFMQDFDSLGGERFPVSGLFIEAPGANTEKNNADLFQKRGQLTRLGLPAAAIALFTLQTYAPTGGAGHRTSLRGGGPLTTLALPPEDHDTLWRRLYLNVPFLQQAIPEDMSQVFGWLAPTRTSESKRPATGPGDVHPLATFWGAPRRIRLDFDEVEGGRCDLTGEPATGIVASYQTKPWGVSYHAIKHPLSPMRRDKPGAEWLFMHPSPVGLVTATGLILR